MSNYLQAVRQRELVEAERAERERRQQQGEPQVAQPETAVQSEPAAVPLNGRRRLKPPAEVEPVASEPRPPLGRLTFRREEIPALLGISLRLFERELSAKRFPRADKMIGRVGLWKLSTINEYLERE
jgi:predicted DNA-binding transcriptional regulator AlpA